MMAGKRLEKRIKDAEYALERRQYWLSRTETEHGIEFWRRGVQEMQETLEQLRIELAESQRVSQRGRGKGARRDGT